MANYTGDPTNTQAPSPDPRDDAFDVGDLPGDLDPPNAATFAQPFKAIYNKLAFLRRPRAKPSAWATAIQRWQNALLQDRFLVDHLGFPGGRVVSLVETWKGTESQMATGGATFVQTDLVWTVDLGDAGAGALGQIKVNDGAKSRNLLMGIGVDAGDTAYAYTTPMCATRTDNAIVMEADHQDLSAAVAGQRVVVGMCKVSGGLWADANSFIGAAFYKGNGNANWMCVTGDGTTLGTPIDSGVAYGAGYDKLRIETHGSGVADDTTNAVRFYINGALVGTATSNLPFAHGTPLVGAVLALKHDSSSAEKQHIWGPLRWSFNY